MTPRLSRSAAVLALATAASLGGVAACSHKASKIAASAGDTTTTADTAPADPASTTTLKPSTGPSSSTTAKTGPTSSTIAYFTVPPSTTAQPPDGGGYAPGESVGRKFIDAVMDGKRSAATPLATKAVIAQFEPWKPYSRTNDQGVEVPSYHYSGSTKKGTFSAVLQPTVTVSCNVDTGKVVSCSFGE